MNWLFFILVLMNLGFFAAHYFGDLSKDPPQPTSASLGMGEGGIVLFAELADKTTPKPIAKTEIADSSKPAQKLKQGLMKSCFELSGFAPFESAKAGLDALLEAGFVGDFVEYQIEVPSGYWVLTKRFNARSKALEELREMQKLAIDSYIIESGENKNAISVGLFKSNRHALNRKAKVERLGFEVELKENTRLESQYKLDIVFRGLKAAPSPLKFIKKTQGEITLTEKKCEEKDH